VLPARFVPLVEHFILRESGLGDTKTACALGCNTIQDRPHLSFRLPVFPSNFCCHYLLVFQYPTNKMKLSTSV